MSPSVAERLTAAGTLPAGFADGQPPWCHAPAVDLPRAVWFEWLSSLALDANLRSVVVVGGAAAAGPAASLAAFGLSVQTRDVDAAPVASDGLLLVCDDGEQLARAWSRHAGAVRDGGVVAVLDHGLDGLALPSDGVVDTLLHIEQEVLAPNGVAWARCGQARAVHHYRQHSMLRRRRALATMPVEPPRDLGEYAGHRCVALAGTCYAVEAGDAPFDRRSLRAHRHGVVLLAADLTSLHRHIDAWRLAEPALVAARARYAKDSAAGEAAIAAVVLAAPELFAVLQASLEQSPWQLRTLLAAGTLALVGPEPRVGIGLLERAVARELDGDVVRVVAQAWLQRLGDAAGAQRFRTAIAREVRRRQVASICQAQTAGHVLWQYPDVHVERRGVVHVGLGARELMAGWRALGVERVVELPLGGASVDACVEQGRLDASAFDLLVVDAEGAELTLLRAASRLLPQLEYVVVTLWPLAQRSDVPLPQDVQTFLRTGVPGAEFGLRAFEARRDGCSGTALFKRVRADGGPR